jgi:hypothetical protein
MVAASILLNFIYMSRKTEITGKPLPVARGEYLIEAVVNELGGLKLQANCH